MIVPKKIIGLSNPQIKKGIILSMLKYYGTVYRVYRHDLLQLNIVF